MTAALHRRSILSLLGLAPAAAAAGSTPAAVLGAARIFPGVGTLTGSTGMVLSGSSFEAARKVPVFPDDGLHIPATLTPAVARAEAALAPAFPAEIAAYRSFAPHLRRRLYRELLAREAARLHETWLASPPPSEPRA